MPVPEEVRRPSRARRLLTRFLPLLAVVAAGGYVAACALVPLPEPALRLSVEASEEFAVDEAIAQAVVDAQALPTAIGWQDGEKVWSNDEASYSIASMSKLVTVLVGQEARPLEPGADGPTYTWTEYDRERQDHYLSLEGVAYPIPVGTEVTEREMLTLMLLPSANDFAEAYARWVFGDLDTFLAAVDDWKQRNGLDSLELVEPTGMDEGNRANAADLLRIGRMVLENPTLAEFTRTPEAEMPWGIGLVENTNPLLGELPGIVGLKTGTLYATGYNYAVAQQSTAGSREIVKLSVTLGRESHEQRAQSGRDMLAALESMPQELAIVESGEPLGTLTSIDGQMVNLSAAEGLTSWLLPGEVATRTVEAGPQSGEITVEAPDFSGALPIHYDGEIVEPDLWWRLTHPDLLFG